MNQKKKPQVIVTLKKVQNGFIIFQESDKNDTTVRIKITSLQPGNTISNSQQKISQQNINPLQQPQIQQQQPPIHPIIKSPQQQFIYQTLGPVLQPTYQMQQPKQQFIHPSSMQQQQVPYQQQQQKIIQPIQQQNNIIQTFEIYPPQKIKEKQVQENQKISIPTFSSWFQFDKIHSIEKENFKEYFIEGNKQKTPKLYKKYRNFIINLYQNQPDVYLTITECRKKLSADACSIVRIHGFLNHWGIINSQVDQEQVVTKILPQPALPQNLYYKLFEQENQDKQEKDYEIIIDAIQTLSTQLRPICDSCQIRCSLVWYQQKPIKDVKEIILCIKCFGNNNFPNILCADDFYKTNIEEKIKGINTDINFENQVQLQLLNDENIFDLLTMINTNNECNWDEILENINQNRKIKLNQVDIIMQFLQYPLKKENSILKTVELKDYSKSTIYDLAKKIASEEPQIFSDSSNLFMCHLSVFRKLLNQNNLTKKNGEISQLNGNIREDEDILRNQNIFPNNFSESEQLNILSFKEQSMKLAQNHSIVEETQIHKSINTLINLQVELIQSKLQLMEEYEKLVINEKAQLELAQKEQLAERLMIVQQKLQIFLEESNQ